MHRQIFDKYTGLLFSLLKISHVNKANWYLRMFYKENNKTLYYEE